MSNKNNIIFIYIFVLEFSLLKIKKDEYDLLDGDSLTDYQRKELIDKLGMTDFINDVPCSFGKAPYAGSGWTNGNDPLFLLTHSWFKEHLYEKKYATTCIIIDFFMIPFTIILAV